MIAFLIVLIILFIITLIFLILCLSSIEIELDKLWFDSRNKKCKKKNNYIIIIKLKLLNKITWFKIKIDNKKIMKIKNSKFLKGKVFQKLDNIQNVKDIILNNKKDLFNLKILKELSIQIKKLNLKMELSAVNSIITSFSVAVIASFISIILAKCSKQYNRNNYYKITPIYESKPIFKVSLNCIIDIKIVHIINIIYMLIKKRSVEYDERTSNRRTYVCSND